MTRTRPVDISPEILGPAEIQKRLDAYLSHRKPESRASSFDYCYNYFQGHYENDAGASLAEPQHIQLSCLQLGFFLASWGMLRGPLLKRSVKHYERLIRVIATAPPELWGIDVDDYSNEACAALLDMRLRIRDSLPDHVSNTLESKVMLGVFGGVPAYDRSFRRGFGVQRFNAKSLMKVHTFYRLNAEAIDGTRIYTLDFDSSLQTKRLYPRAKIIDMLFTET